MLLSCSERKEYVEALDRAKAILHDYPDSALTILNRLGIHEEEARIDVENPKGRKGHIHYQQGNKKYIYNSKEKKFIGAPNKVNDLLQRKDIQDAIKKGQKYLGE